MDINKSSFQSQLPVLLNAISTAHFVALDLELSGIHKQPHRANPTRLGAPGKQTLQQRYTETKEAAERYQVLQIGITCVEQDHVKGQYTVRPFNFNLSPLIAEKLDIERIFSFQSGAVDFLLAHGFRLEVPFLEGVPYLSRQEEVLARQRALDRQDRAGFADILLKEDDVESFEFVRRVRAEINLWLNRTAVWLNLAHAIEIEANRGLIQPEAEYLNIAPLGAELDPQDNRGLNNFQKRLVHQLVRAEFPDLVTVSRPLFVQIMAYDQAREDSIKKGRARHLEEQLSRQVGLRWVIEAMVGGDLSGIDPRNFARNKNGEPIFVDLEAMTRDLDTLRTELKSKRTVLVGHNVFTDLMNLYRVFLGPLPDKVEEFQQAIHALFPMVIDTKYLATHECGSINPKSSLDEIEEELRQQPLPVIEVHDDHSKYLSHGSAHEAGYDSFLTATVLIRLSSKLNADRSTLQGGSQILSSDDDDYNEGTGGGVLLRSPSQRPAQEQKRPSRSDRPHGSQRKSTTRPSRNTPLMTMTNRFEALGKPISASPTETLQPASAMRLMPSFDGDFWAVYGNKLRVFGTEEGICNLIAH